MSMQDFTKYLPTRTFYKKSILVLMLLIGIYILDNSSVATYINRVLFTYILKPLLWVGLAVLIWRMPHIKPTAKLRYKKVLYLWAFIFGVAFILINMFAGFLDSLGKSPYDHSLLGIITNIIYVGSVLAGREFARKIGRAS